MPERLGVSAGELASFEGDVRSVGVSGRVWCVGCCDWLDRAEFSGKVLDRWPRFEAKCRRCRAFRVHEEDAGARGDRLVAELGGLVTAVTARLDVGGGADV